MIAVINPQPTASTSSSMGQAKPELLHKIEGHVARVNDVYLFVKEEGVITICDDRSIRIWLKRDNGQFWPSVHHFMPLAPTAMFFDETDSRLLIGLVNGVVYEFIVADDMNSVAEQRYLDVHVNAVTALLLSVDCSLIFSCSKDKTLVWFSSQVFERKGTYNTDSALIALEFDASSSFVFFGSSDGSITILRINDAEAQFVSRLSAHTASISSLAWDAKRQLLFSSSADHLVITWDIGGRKGQAFEMNAHNAKLTCLRYAGNAHRLFSADEDGFLVCWDLMAKRFETPEWKSDNSCQLCNSPFFWNVKEMWAKKVVGSRQHHCRTCGNAVCAQCSGKSVKYPPMGYELSVRICDTCYTKMELHPEQFDMTPLAVSCELRHGIACMHLQEETGLLVTVGLDRVTMIWDVRGLL